MSNAEELLNVLVLQESQIVTYRRLSRELSVHVNTAKELLADFYNANRDKCHATYLVTGTKRPSSNSDEIVGIQIMLISEAGLTALQSELDNAACHVYSLEYRLVEDANAFVMANIQAGCNRDIAELSAVQSSVSQIASAPAYLQKEPPKAPVSNSIDKKPIIGEDDDGDFESGLSTPPPPPPPPKAKDVRSFFGRVPEKKPALATMKSDVDMAPVLKTELQHKESQQTEQSDGDFDMQSVNDESPNDEGSRVEDMFDDEDTGNNSNSNNSNNDSGNASPIKRKAIVDLDVEMAESDEEDSNQAQNPPPEAALSNSGAQASTKRRVRKRRKVSTIKHTKNKRGMLVSQIVDGWESYSESESDTGHGSGAAAVKLENKKDNFQNIHPSAGGIKQQSSSGKAKGAAPQRSILSFFGKK
ncbi:DNA polymerase subunit Cdc27 [Coemansia spiralis]|nr:DNA polymerase subunit Cdc27 [Coemansia spiralis]